MEKFVITAMTLDSDFGDAFVLEGIGDFDTIYPCPVAWVAGRFMHNWVENDGTYAPPQLSLVERISTAKRS